MITFVILVILMQWSSAHLWSLEDLTNGLLYPRPSGSEGNLMARQFILTFFQNLPAWQTETDDFDQDTVIGPVTFSNIIARARPQCTQYMLLACHYDSKLHPSGFVGASDSAVPCALLMNIAQYFFSMQDNTGQDAQCIGLVLVFFDGEEAFIDFNDQDGLYGSKHLAEKWDASEELRRIRLFVLLDLIGEKSPNFFTYSFDGSHKNVYYDVAMQIEDSLNALMPQQNVTNMFSGQSSMFTSPMDDHEPFLERGVDQILHLIPTPFPRNWHTLKDDGSNLDFDSIRRLDDILKLFVNQMLQFLL